MGEVGVSPFSDCGLGWCLQQLDQEELQAFKELLMGSAAGLLPGAFPWEEVPGADAQRLAFLLHGHCRAVVVWSAAMDIFQELSQPVLAQKAREEMEKCSLAEILQDLTPTRTDRGTSMGQPPEVPQVVLPEDAIAAETRDQEVPQVVLQEDAIAAETEDQEVPQVVLQEDAIAAETEDQAMGPGGHEGRYRRYVMVRFAPTRDAHHSFRTFAADCRPAQALSAAFAPDPQGFRPLTVVLHGCPGVGKSALARRVLLHWARGELYAGMFAFAFLLDARDLPWRGSVTLAELLSREWPGPEVPTAHILAQPERLLLIIDGVGRLDLKPHDISYSLGERDPVSHLVGSLLAKALLPECSLLLTARDEDLEKLQGLLVSPRYLLVQGIATETRVRALLTHVQGEHRRAGALHAVLDNHTLTGPCKVSLTWWLLCRALELQAAPGTGLPPAAGACQTLTGLYATFVAHQLAPPGDEDAGRCLGPDERTVLKGLCRLAACGLWAGRSLFSAEDLGAAGLTERELAGLFQRHLLLPDSQGERCFSFPHPSLQAFFAALCYVLEGLEAGWAPQAPGGEASGQPPEPRACDQLLLQARRFLFGLLSRKAAGALEGLLGCALAAPAGLRRLLLCWVGLLGRQPAAPAPADALEACYCLFETQDEEFVRGALGGFRELRLTLARTMDLLVAAFCLGRCGRLRAVRLDVREVFPEDEAAEAWPVIPRGVSSPPPRRLQAKPLVLEWWETLCSALSSHPSLQQLDLAGSVLSEWALRTLCVKLRQPDCKIQKLMFKGTQIAQGLNHLWKTLILSQSIRHLSLDNIHLQEEDIWVVQEALRHPHCVLESLRLDHCGLTDACCPPLAQTLLASRSLTALSLAGNKVTDEGVASLCEALKVPQCALRRLVLGSCGLTDAACAHLSEALAGSQSLTHLDLSTNPLGKDGVALLCRGLKALACALQRLMLRNCGLDAVSCGFLSLGLVGNRHLTHLSLSLNAVGDAGSDLLCEALLEPNARLRDLELVRCGLSAACCRKLALVIRTSPHLQSLDLAANALGDGGVATLCASLLLKTAPLRRLGLEACELTSGCCEALASVMLCSRALHSLNLLRNPLGAEGVRTLCRAFARPASKLRVIGLWKWQFPEHIVKLLEEAELRKPNLVIDGRWYSSGAEDEGDRYWWRN
ncbi:NACHT, LRR and PYD domains-containing protein 5 [Pipistrellus kuhlii]|uniref:NACHT, LRR and PYD domains-containing protein 5 n=1 Tax=Pipistrellus kuhlii TaxID=59472 RepID=UPI001E26FA76|nr:NACHT, LRR and PYD domains-containing protein 5 [Pipistrellus kuhlii]